MRGSTRLPAVTALLIGTTLVGVPVTGAAPAAGASRAGAPAAARYSVIALGTLGGEGSVAQGLNDRGEVIGWSHTTDGRPHPFLWRNGRMTDLGTLDHVDGGWGIAAGINRYGTAVGGSERGGVTRAVRWQHGRITALGTLGGDYSFATAINDHGVIVGNSTTADGVLHAFIWRNGRMTDLGVPGGGDAAAEDVNNRGQVVGWTTPVDRPSRAYLWQRGKVTLLPTSRYGSRAGAVNDRGEIVGSWSLVESQVAVRWWHGRLTRLGYLPGGNASAASDINDRGVVLGGGNVRPYSLDDHAALWIRGVPRDLSTAGVPTGASNLNNRGQIIGSVPDPTGVAAHAALFVPVRGHRS